MSALSASIPYPPIGMMAMPEDFSYRRAFLHGRPKHDKYSCFRIRHPKMPCARRAKLFAPFDALKWFDERIAAKEVLYEPKRQLSESENEELARKLSILHRMTFNRKAAEKYRPLVTATFFEPCSDADHDAFGSGGSCRKVSGIISRLDPVIERKMVIGGQTVLLEDLIDIDGDLF